MQRTRLERLIQNQDDSMLPEDICQIFGFHPMRGNVANLPYSILNGRPCAAAIVPREIEIYSHTHEFLEIMYVYKGTITQNIQDAAVTLYQGDFCILTESFWHCISTLGQEDIVLNIIISKEHLTDFLYNNCCRDSALGSYFSQLLSERKPYKGYLIARSNEDSGLYRTATEIISEIQNGDCYQVEITEALIHVMLLQMLKYTVVHKESCAYTENQALFKNEVTQEMVLDYINNHSATITRKQLADRFGYNENYMSLVIRNACGISFTDLRNRYRLRRASLLLKTTELPVAQIARMVGYKNTTQFYKKFKEGFNESPSHHRSTQAIACPSDNSDQIITT